MSHNGYKLLAIAVIKQALDDARLKKPTTKRQILERDEAIRFLRSRLRKDDREFWCSLLGLPEDKLKTLPLYQQEKKGGKDQKEPSISAAQ